MLNLQRAHPRFSMELEVLSALPKQPDSVPLDALVEDFGFGAQHEVRRILLNLQDEGYLIATLNVEGQRAACIRRSGWEKARDAAEKYLQALNDPSSVPNCP